MPPLIFGGQKAQGHRCPLDGIDALFHLKCHFGILLTENQSALSFNPRTPAVSFLQPESFREKGKEKKKGKGKREREKGFKDFKIKTLT